MYVIVRDDGKYAAPPGQEKSYTDRLEDAWVFRDRRPWGLSAMRFACQHT